MRIAIVGCGYVADFYMETLPNHPMLELVAACDTDPQRRAVSRREDPASAAMRSSFSI